MQNNPIAYVDYFGLASETNDGNKDEFQEYFYGEYEPHCFCERHRNCKRGGDVASAIGGAAHGVVDYMIGSLLDLQTTAAYIGSSELELSGQERSLIIETIEKSQARQMAFVGSRVMGMLAVDHSDTIYQSFRSNTKLGLEISSLVAGGYGAVKGVIGFSKLARMPIQISGIIRVEKSLSRVIGKSNKIWTSTKQRTSVKNAYIHWQAHGADFSELLNAKQYVEATTSFINHPPPGTLAKIRANGDIIFYNPSTNTFAISNAEGLPRTMYKPSLDRHPYPTNLEYFNAQR